MGFRDYFRLLFIFIPHIVSIVAGYKRLFHFIKKNTIDFLFPILSRLFTPRWLDPIWNILLGSPPY